MAEIVQGLTKEDFLRDDPITVENITSGFAPLTEQAATNALGQPRPGRMVAGTQAIPLTDEQQFQQENIGAMPEGIAGPSAPIRTMADTSTLEGALGFIPLSTRFQLGRRKEFQDQFNYLNHRYPGKVRVSKDGMDFILKLPDEEAGGEKEVLVNDRAINLGDFASLAGKAPEFAAGLLAALLARRIPGLKPQPLDLKGTPTGPGRGPKVNFARDVVAGSLGMELASAGQSIAINSEMGEPLEVRKSFEEAGKDFLPDVAIGYGIGGIFKVLNAAFKATQTPFSFSRGPVQTDGLEAASRLEKTLKTPLIYSPADATGSPILAQGQAYVRSVGAGAGPSYKRLAEIEASKDATFRAITAGAKSDEEVGRQLVSELQAIRDVAEGRLTTAARTLETQGAAEVGAAARGVAGESVGPGSGFSPIVKGQQLRSTLETSHSSDTATKNQLYADAYAEPGALERNFSTTPIQKKLVELKKDLPTRHIEKEEVVYDQYGGTMTATSTKAEPVSEFIHPEVKRFLSAKLDPEMKLGELVKMRDMLYDEIAQGEAVQGIPTRHLKMLAGSMTQSIKEGVDALPQGALKQKLQAANKFYETNVLRWEEPGFHDLFRKSKEGAGFVSDEAVLGRLKERPSQFLETLKRVKGTPGETALRGSVMDDILNRSTSGLGSDTIDGKSLLKAIDEYRLGPNKDIAREVFGNKLNQLVAGGRKMAAGQGSITMDQAKTLLANDAPSLNMLFEMTAATRKVNELYKNQLIKDFTAGKLDVNTVNVEKALNSFLDTGTTSDLKFLTAALARNPDLAEQLQRKTLEKILRKAGPNIDDKSLRAVLNDPQMEDKFRVVLDRQRWETMQDLAAALAPYRITKEFGAGAGMLAKGSSAGALLRFIINLPFNAKGGTKEFKEFMGYKIIALALTNPKVEAWMLSTPVPMFKDLGKAVVISEPFLKALNEDVSDASEKAGIVNSIRQMFGFAEPPQSAADRRPVVNMSREEFLKP